MFIHVKQACEFRRKDGEKWRALRDFIGTPPEWIKEDPLFGDLVNCGKITVHESTKGVDESAKADKKRTK